MKTALIVISSIVTIVSLVPYVIETLQGKAKPRVVSWFTWSVLAGIGCAAALADRQYPSAILMALAAVETFVVVILGLRLGDRKLELFDIVCLLGAVTGLVLWQVFDSPTIAVIAVVVIDFIGSLPTLKHSWEKPHEETALAFFLAGIGGLCTFLAAGGSWKVTAVAYPLYIAIINAILVTTILGRSKKLLQGEPAELRKL